jgi:hypothetical protein
LDRSYWTSTDDTVVSPLVERQVSEIIRRGWTAEGECILATSGWEDTLHAINDVVADARRRAGIDG